MDFKNEYDMLPKMIKPNDSVSIFYLEKYALSDGKWYSRFKADSVVIELKLNLNDKNYIIPFYIKGSDPLRTYPFNN